MSAGTAPVKYIVGILTAQERLRDEVVQELSRHLGGCDFIGPWHTFTHTNFYAAEMGQDLKRSFISFEVLSPPELIHKLKRLCVEVEDKFRIGGRRRVNLDPGYIDHFKVVLVSGKFGGHKIAIKNDCWVDFIAMYCKGAWHPLPWAFPDFTAGIYDKDLLEIRRLFKSARRSSASHTISPQQ